MHWSRSWRQSSNHHSLALVNMVKQQCTNSHTLLGCYETLSLFQTGISSRQLSARSLYGFLTDTSFSSTAGPNSASSQQSSQTWTWHVTEWSRSGIPKLYAGNGTCTYSACCDDVTIIGNSPEAQQSYGERMSQAWISICRHPSFQAVEITVISSPINEKRIILCSQSKKPSHKPESHNPLHQ